MSGILYTGLGEGFGAGSSPSGQNNSGDKVIVGQVLDVVYDDKSPYYDGPETIGMVRLRNLNTQYNVKEKEVKQFAMPMDRSNYSLPLPGEQVVCVRAFGTNIAGSFVSRLYYMNVVSSESTTLSNITPFLGTDPYHIKGGLAFAVNVDAEAKRFEKKIKHNLKDMEGKTSIQKLREGDKIIEGRFGGSIKFTSTIASDKTQDETYGDKFKNNNLSAEGDPMVVIKSDRRPVTTELTYTDDNPNLDDVSVYLTTSQIIPIKLACSDKMYSWNLDISMEGVNRGKDQSQIYQKIIDTTIPVEQAYQTPAQ